MQNIIKEKTLAAATREALSRVLLDPEYETAPRGQKIREILNMQITIENPLSNLFINEKRDIPKKYLANELLLYFTGINNATKFEEAASLWGKIKNSDNTINSAYGNLIFTNKEAKWQDEFYSKEISQWQWAKKSLVKDKDSRQAIMHYNSSTHQYADVKDFPCTLYNQFFIRNNKLNLSCYMRSNDLVTGWTFDAVFFMLLMQCMLLELKEFYPDLTLGSYIHHAGSMHIYEKNFETVQQMLENTFTESNLPMLEENPIYHSELFNLLYNNEIKSDDKFLNWIKDNK